MDTTTALAFVLSENSHDKINEIRSKHDKAYPRWMPHINFIFPFVKSDKFDEVCDKLKNLKTKSFNVVLDTINYFPQQDICTVHMKPSKKSCERLATLFNEIMSILSDVSVKHKEFHPHATIGQFTKDTIDEQIKILKEWLNIGFVMKCDRICILQRDPNGDDQMKIVREIGLSTLD